MSIEPRPSVSPFLVAPLSLSLNAKTHLLRRAAAPAVKLPDGGYRHLPVVHSGKVDGIVSRRDFKGLKLDRFKDETLLWECIC